jgi:drug/metabolite transporter (DMT)-like permease
MTPGQQRHRQAVLLLLLTTFFWALSFPVIKAVMLLHGRADPAAGPLFVTCYAVAPRFFLATLVLLAIDGWRLRRAVPDVGPGEWRQGLLVGVSGGLGMLFQNDGLKYTNASTSAFITQIYAILIPIWVAACTRRNPGARIWAAMGLVMAGVSILGRVDWRNFHFGRGEWETLASALFFGAQILLIGTRQFAACRSSRVTLVMFATEAVLFGSIAAAAAPRLGSLAVPWADPTWVAMVLVLTFVCTLATFTIMNAWQPCITPTEAGLIYCAEPVFASAFALFLPNWVSAWGGIEYPNERATQAMLLGGGLITIANVLVQLKPPQKG